MDEILKLIEPVSEGFPSYFCRPEVAITSKFSKFEKAVILSNKIIMPYIMTIIRRH